MDPQLAARYQRLVCESGGHHVSAVCNVATVLLTRIASCLGSGTRYELRDVDGRLIDLAEGRAIVQTRYQIPEDVRAARRTINRNW